MIVKIGTKTYSSKEEPILVELSKEEIERVRNMKYWERRICSFPQGKSANEIRDFIAGVPREQIKEQTITE